MNRTMMGKVRSMLSDVCLSQYYWVELVDTTCYVVNRLSMPSLVNKTPYDDWDHKSPSLANLKVFGCDAFVHILKERRQNLDNNSEKCIFVKYKDGVKGYKLWNLASGSVFYNRNVILREFGSTSEFEDLKKVKELEKLEFDLNNESHDLDGSTKSKEELEVQTLVMRRSSQARKQPKGYSSPDFLSNLALSTIEEYPKTVKEAINLTKGGL